MPRWMVVTIVALVAVATYAVFAVVERRGYARDVAAEARQRGIEPSSLRYPAHWPLDFYLPRLQTAQSPESADSIVLDADSTVYFLVPMANSETDSALIEVFYFQVGKRTNAIQAQFVAGRLKGIEGADWLPDRQYRRSRGDALAWYHTQATSTRPDRP